MQIEPGIAVVCPGWKNRPISEKPKIQPHEGSPYNRRRFAHWRELLTRTMPGRIALLLGAVILLGVLTATFGHLLLGAHPSYGEALWESLSHMLDPGQLSDDHTGAQRVVGVTQVLIGIVFLAGIVLTVLTEVVDRAVLRMRKGDPSIRVQGHLLVIGVNETLAEVTAQLAVAGEDDRPPIAVLLSPGQADQRHLAERALRGYPGRTHVVVADPSGDGFDRICAGDARHIVLLSPDIEADRADLLVTTTAMLLARHLASVGSNPPVAAEIRRGRNADALWYDRPGGSRRFPASFDALVNDRNIGALLAIVALNPHFTGVFLSQGDAMASPDLIPAGRLAEKTFGEAVNLTEGATLLGILSGSGPEARADYLPPATHRIGADDRLIVIRDDSPGNGRAGAAFDPDSIKVAPVRPGPLLILGFSDSAAALIDTLAWTGVPSGRISVLDPADRSAAGRDVEWIEGDPGDAEDVASAIERSEPAIAFSAAEPGRQAEAVITGHLARRATAVPVVIEQRAPGPELPDLVPDRSTVVSTSALTAEAVALSMTDPALLVAREAMFSDPGLVLESLTYTGSEPLPLGEVSPLFSRAGYHPLAVALSEESAVRLDRGDHILAMHREGSPPDQT